MTGIRGPEIAVISGFGVYGVVGVLGGMAGRLMNGTFLACVAVVCGLQVAHSWGRPLGWPWPRRLAALSAQAVAAFLPALWAGPRALSMTALLAASILLAVSGPLRWPLYFAAGAGVTAVSVAAGAGIAETAFALAFTMVNGFAVFGLAALTASAAEMRAGQEGPARAAVVRERLRLARDLHDLLGHHVAALTLKGELACRLLPLALDKAGAELEEIRAIVRRITAEVRVMALGGRDLSFAEEIDAVRSTLASARIDLRVDNRVPVVPRAVDTVLAVVLREAVTNMLRHSKAESSAVECSADVDVVRLRVVNDGSTAEVRGTTTRGSGTGTGLRNLAVRLEAVGGRLTAWDDHAGRFHLVAEVPLGDPARRRALSDRCPRTAGAIASLVLGGYALKAALAGVLWQAHASGAEPVDHWSMTTSTLLSGIVVFRLSRLWATARKAHSARVALVWTAVHCERRRMAYELQRLLGHPLSQIGRRCDRARELMAYSPERAREELTGVIDLARAAVAEVRSTAVLYRRPGGAHAVPHHPYTLDESDDSGLLSIAKFV